MNGRTIQEIETEMDEVSRTGNIGRMMDLVDEHGNTFDKMYQAIIDGDLDRIEELENIGMKITDESFVKAAIIHDQLLVIVYQISKEAEIDMIINFSKFPLQLFVWNNINTETLMIDLMTLPTIALGAFIGFKVVKIIPEHTYRGFVIAITVISAFLLLL